MSRPAQIPPCYFLQVATCENALPFERKRDFASFCMLQGAKSGLDARSRHPVEAGQFLYPQFVLFPGLQSATGRLVIPALSGPSCWLLVPGFFKFSVSVSARCTAKLTLSQLDLRRCGSLPALSGRQGSTREQLHEAHTDQRSQERLKPEQA